MAGCVSRANKFCAFGQSRPLVVGPIDWPAHQFVTCVKQLVYRNYNLVHTVDPYLHTLHAILDTDISNSPPNKTDRDFSILTKIIFRTEHIFLFPWPGMRAEVSCGVLTCFFSCCCCCFVYFDFGQALPSDTETDTIIASRDRQGVFTCSVHYFSSYFSSFFCFFLSVRALLLIATIAQVCVHGLREVEHNRIEMELNNSTCGMLQHNNVYILAFLVYKRASISTPLLHSGASDRAPSLSITVKWAI